ncbi:hypothetical protein C0585_04465 [Candidatus Woesearchaeota archaeon]|nr:MAG: hypothetical protein C0585_04465 [Candidatus Woesearchaeota archaeon]
MDILFYQDKKTIGIVDDSTDYLRRNLETKGFNIDLETEEIPREGYDWIFNRFERPTEEFLIKMKGDNIINPGNNILDHASKYHLLLFPELTTQTIITDDVNLGLDFMKEYKNIIIKPVGEFGGKGVKKIYYQKKDYDNIKLELENRISKGEEFVFQRYIDNVEKLGDKRINIVFYEPVSCVLRKPMQGSFICNLSSGGSMQRAELNKRDYEIIEAVTPFLKANNLNWVGMDVIGNYLTELNLKCPGMVYEADHINGNKLGLESMIAGLTNSKY